jgi:amino-acid N-acetyltransferase
MPIRRAAEADVPAVVELLRDAGLPLIGVSEAFRTGYVAHDGDVLVGAAAIEPYHTVALLRSVVVRPSARGAGVGRELVAAVQAYAVAIGVRTVFLLTETAEAWFRRLGYETVDRSRLPEAILASDEMAIACAARAVAMRTVITPPRDARS